MSLWRAAWLVGSVGVGMAACGQQPLPSKDEAHDNEHVDLVVDPDDGQDVIFIDDWGSGGQGGASACDDAPIEGAAGAEAGAVPQALPTELPGCPAVEPVVSDCRAASGVECLYASTEGCFSPWICSLALWERLPERCFGDDGELVAASGARCPTGAPVPTTPCGDKPLLCGYGACPAHDIPVLAECTCGRWLVVDQGCVLK